MWRSQQKIQVSVSSYYTLPQNCVCFRRFVSFASVQDTNKKTTTKRNYGTDTSKSRHQPYYTLQAVKTQNKTFQSSTNKIQGENSQKKALRGCVAGDTKGKEICIRVLGLTICYVCIQCKTDSMYVYLLAMCILNVCLFLTQ